jgi:3-methylcrotonyl-CoA carboxylase alpha subunit
VQICGHAVEARLYAEDPERGFLPSTGQLQALVLPQGECIRIDTGVEEGDAVSPFYDPMIAKIIAYAPTRTMALERLAHALDETRVAGPRCNARFLAALCRSPDFMREQFDTSYIERHLDALGAVAQPLDRSAVAAGLAALLHGERRGQASDLGGSDIRASDPWAAQNGFQLAGPRRLTRLVRVDQEILSVSLVWDADGFHVADEQGIMPIPHPATLTLRVEAGQAYCVHRGRQSVVAFVDPVEGREEGGSGDGRLRAPMHGKLVALMVDQGDAVSKGQRVAVIEAMKMEHALLAPFDGVVDAIHARAGDQVGEAALLLEISAAAEAE